MESKKAGTGRLAAIDALRGTVMIIMALDHVRDFVSRDAMLYSPTDLAHTTPFLFFTRWITHFCAPVFMLTAGMGAFFWYYGKRTKKQLSGFLLSRGAWLIVLELLVMRGAYYFTWSLQYPVFLIVLWVLGACMIVLAALIWLPAGWLAVFSLAVVALHNLADGIQPKQLGAGAPLWIVLHQPGAFPVGKLLLIVAYPLVPWFAVMACGFCVARVFLREPAARQRILLRIGVACTLLFVVLRAVNIYGDRGHWAAQSTPVYTVLSFLNCAKYPPSLDFLLMTLGPALVVLALYDRRRFSAANPVLVMGRVPLLFFVIHFYAAHAAGAVLALLRYGRTAWRFLWIPMPTMGGPNEAFPAGFGFDLWVVYAVWIAVVAGLYPLCRWFAGLKARRRDWWLSYI